MVMEEHDCKDYIDMTFENMGDPVICPICGEEYYMESEKVNGKFYFHLERIG